MEHNSIWIIAVITVCAVCTILERAFPFLLFRGKEVPEPINDLGKMLPMAIITTLIFYCVRSIEFSSPGRWVPQLVSCAVTTLLHLWRGTRSCC